MKKYILILFLVILIIPSIALASWWNPFSWKIFNKKTQISVVAPIIQNTSDEEIQKLKQEIEDLKKQKTNIPITTKSDNNETKKQIQTQIDSVLKDKAEQEALIAKQKIDEIKNIVTQPVSTQVTIQKPEIVDNSSPQRFFREGQLNLGDYNELYASDYIKNRKASLNKPIKIMSGKIIAFNQNSKNYIEIVDSNNTSNKSIELYVKNDNDYTIITNELVIGDKIIAYGYGISDTKFIVVSSSGQYDSYEPTIELDAIYKCKNTSECRFPYNVGVEKIFTIKQ